MQDVILKNMDCMDFLPTIKSGGVDMVLTDIPYDGVNNSRERQDDGRLRKIRKGDADIITFELDEFLEEVYRVAKSTVVIFCGMGQFSTIYNFFIEKGGTTRTLVWEKTNPSPMNGEKIYLSGIELAVWHRKPKGTFNAFCKNTVFRYPCGESKVHPTEKNYQLLNEIILDNSNVGDTILDPCMGSGRHIIQAIENGRKAIGCELNAEWFNIAKQRIETANAQETIFGLL